MDEAESNKAMVESLLKEWSAGGGAPEGGAVGMEGGEDGEVEEDPEAEVPDDDQINEMMSTHDSELLIYQQMDRERRIAKEKQWSDYSKRLPRGSAKLEMPSGTIKESRVITHKSPLVLVYLFVLSHW